MTDTLSSFAPPSYSVRPLNGVMNENDDHIFTTGRPTPRHGLYYGDLLMAIIDPGWERQVVHMVKERELAIEASRAAQQTQHIEVKVDEEWHHLRGMEG